MKNIAALAGAAVLAVCSTLSSPLFADLPTGYTQVPYIQANGNCQIRTGITPACTDKVEMTWRPIRVDVTENLWCSRSGTTSGQFTAFQVSNKIRIDRNAGSAGQVTSAAALLVGTNYTIVADYAAGTCVVTNIADNTEVISVAMANTDAYDPGSELCLFGSHSTDPDTGYSNPAYYALYSFKLLDSSGDLRLDLVPARRDADGEIGLYDAKNDAFLTNCLSGTFLAGLPPPSNTYVWIGGASGNLSTAANWSPTPAGAFTADDELVVNDAAEITVDAAATVGKITVNAAGGTRFVASGANALTVTQIANAGAGDVTFGCPVNFSGTYYVEKNGAVKFPGGATATYPDNLLRTAASTPNTLTLDGEFTFTEDWIVNNVGDYPWIVASNSVVHGKNFSGTQVSRHRILRVEQTGSAYFTTVTNGWDKGDIDIDGYLEVSGEIIVITSPSGGSSGYSRFGRSGNVGTAKAPRIAKTEHGACQCYVPNLIVGAGGLGALTKDYYWEFDVDATVTATDSFEILGLFRSGNSYDWGLRLNGHQLTINVPENMTVTYGVAESGTGGSIRKTGAGTLVMTDTYNGDSGFVKQYANGTVIEEGVVRLEAAGQLGTGPVTISSGARLEIADGISPDNQISGEGTLRVEGETTLADGVRWNVGEMVFASGAKVIVQGQTTQGVIATGVSQADFTACFEAANGALSWANGSVSYGNSFVWVGTAGGKWSDAANWSWNGVTGAKAPLDDAYADASFTNAATAVVDVPVTFQDLYISGAGAVKFENPTVHGSETKHVMMLASVTSSATVMPVIDCGVKFAGTYKVAFTNKAVNFAGGAIATDIDSGNALTSPTADLYGNFMLTQGWTIPTAPSATATVYTHILRSGSTMTTPVMTLIHKDMGAVGRTTQLLIDAGATANVGTVLHQCGNDTWNNCRHAISVHCNGTLNVKTMYRVDGDYSGGRVGMHKHKGSNNFNGTGTFNLQGIECITTKQTDWHTWLEQWRTNIGASGIRVASGFNTGAFGFAHGMTVGALADYTIRSERATPSVGLYGNLTFDTLDAADGVTPRTITITANLTDLTRTHANSEYPNVGKIIKNNPGTLVLSGDNTYSNGTTINGGTVRAESDTALGTGAVTVAAGATLELAPGVTITNSVTFADGATLVCGEGSQISGPVTRNGTVNLRLLGTCTIFPSGYTDTDGFTVTADSAVGTLSVDGGALKYDARAVGTYTWTGAVNGNFSTPGNWSVNDEAVHDVPGALDTIRFAPASATTVTLDADATVAAMVIEGAGALTIANPSGATTNTLTLTSITSSATTVPMVGCKVQFTGKYTVSFTNKAVNFTGGATATTWDSANTASAPTSEFMGNITFTEDWTVPSTTGNACYVRNGATVTCPTLILPHRSASYNQRALLQVDDGGTINCRKVEQNGSTTYYNGVGDGVVVYVNGTGALNVSESYNMNNCGRIGIFKQQGNNNLQATGTFNLKGIVADSTTTDPKWIEHRKLNLGAGGILVKATDVTGIGIGPQITLGALADYAIRYEGTGSKVHFHAPVTFDTYDSAAGVARTVSISADVEDGKSVGTYSPGRYDVGGAIIKKNAGTLVVSGNNTFTGGTTVNGGTLLAAHDHALGTGAALVGADGTLELMEGVSVTNAVTLAANATLLIDGAEARTAAGTSVVGTIATPSTGTATLKVTGDFSDLTSNVTITLGALADGASVSALTLDMTELAFPNAEWRAKLKEQNGLLVMDVKKPSGLVFILR
ncbi:MAG: autotransporter-associated beta strand repeat-containing protein [Kiritimatiellae bacterium]|nr:autotransporter-associated beta strand repeat-containing protein [Kiritimatiellia bacterium]